VWRARGHGGRQIHEPESRPRLFVLRQQSDAAGDPIFRSFHLVDQALAGLPATLGEREQLMTLRINPESVKLWEFVERLYQSCAAGV
jgi:hypothetical protein